MKKNYFLLTTAIFFFSLIGINKLYSQGTNCSSATNLTINGACGSGTISDNTQSAPNASGCSFGTFRREGWYSFTVTGGPLNISIAANATNQNLFLQLLSSTSSCTGLSQINCANTTTTNGAQTETISTTLSNGIYYIKVINNGSNNNMTLSSICVTSSSLTNDNCTGAIPLTINATCNYTTYSNSSATASTTPSTPPDPNCATYLGGDVWFSFTVPPSGNVTVDMQTGTMTDAGMAWYTGTCGSLSLLECNDDGSTNGSMSKITRTGLTSGATIYVRIWGYNNTYGTFGICATTPNTSITCTQGDSQGTTTLGCPSVTSGGLNLSGSDPDPISCSATSTCIDLEATYLNLGETTSYLVESIPYQPPYQFNCLKNPVSVNTDDIWSPIINLPFEFCFYGNTYNQCLIGSNGVITFDITNNLPGDTCGWSFNANLPVSGDNSLIENSIFGVFHDIDPSKGGEVGWELITLNTGCRALVASWNDVPMYEENSSLYTGMIVLYENTNVIEVYIKEKNIDNLGAGTWNDGNAVVGIQNETGTIGTVAPNRNGLDPNWAVTNEAWRFVPDGNSITSITWYEGSGTSGLIVGNTDQINVCPTSTTTYTAEVTYQLCGGATLTEIDETTITINSNKVWVGSVNSDWNNANNWTPTGVPTDLDCVVIPSTSTDPIINGTSYNGLGLNLLIHNNANLTVTSDNNITITDWVNINLGGNLELQDNASLIQINNIANTGIMNMHRNANVRRLDYVYWSSPVSNFPLTNILGSSKYKWEPTIPSGYTSDFGNWISTGENMLTGKGYIVKSPSNFLNTFQTLTGTFTGTPNNGNISVPIVRSSYNGINYLGPTTTPVTKDDDNWNLIGNPYPSSINAIDFLTLNTNIAGFIKVWTHGTLPSLAIPDPFYEDFGYNYTVNDYITYNAAGSSSGPNTYDGYIAAGQGFFVLMNHTSSSTSENVLFNNSMRHNTYSNNQFFRTSGSTQIEKNRIWLDIIDQTGSSARTMIGYITNATNEIDRLYDATAVDKNNFDIYSIAETAKLNIQSRKLPFVIDDQVQLGMYIPQSGSYSIAINAVDGLFSDSNNNIYIEDLQNEIIHDLKLNPYSFTSNSGNIDNRFILRYTTNTLSNLDVTPNENNIIVISNENLTIKATEKEIKTIQIFDVLGKKLTDIQNISTSEVIVQNLQKNNTTLILQIELVNGNIIHKKVIF
ncbi:hypothetical protein SY27_17510 [Flavobacterium sp. 316]|uniref:hypothetical protein n=1 Tax=Flavobacterium sp. 316 TaxID=1603293 RepID=UPI0005E561AC|nr:hypothetical protein [Flavobacterium sp. 316]KIX19843.1 hypothetical protein SY27_17510 [Flavobacterium sp. 316]